MFVVVARQKMARINLFPAIFVEGRVWKIIKNPLENFSYSRALLGVQLHANRTATSANVETSSLNASMSRDRAVAGMRDFIRRYASL